MPKISVFTPTHDTRFLDEAYQSLLAQDFDDWEWVILYNGDGTLLFGGSFDSRVRQEFAGAVKGVGDAKKLAVSLCEGDILVELDHDDTLEPNCLSEVYRAFQDHPDASLVYSRWVEMNEDGSPRLVRFADGHGWDYQEVDGYLSPGLMLPTPHNVSLIWYAPNHVRAFTYDAYKQVGGYNPTLKVLDDQDLMAKLYRAGEFVGIDKVLYRQRFHGGNTQLESATNDHIQVATLDMYEETIMGALEAWSEREGLEVSVNGIPDQSINFDDSIFGLIRTVGDLKPDETTYYTMEDIWALLAPNGMLLSMSREDKWINEFYFRSWCSGDDAPFQISRLRTFESNGVKWVQANLIAVKEGYTREGGYLHNLAFK